MAYAKFLKRRYPKGTFKKKNTQKKRIAKIETHLASSELHWIPGSYAQAAGAPAGFTVNMFPVNQGDGPTTRNGDYLKPMFSMFHWYWQNSSITNYWQVRGILIRINNTAGLVTAGDLLDQGGLLTQASYNPAYTKIPNIKDKFVKTGVEYEILYDTGTISLAPFVANTGGNKNLVQIRKKFRYNKRKPVRFNGPADTNNTSGTIRWVTFVQNTAVVEGGQFGSYFLPD